MNNRNRRKQLNNFCAESILTHPLPLSVKGLCVKEACLIQKCLARNGSREEKCAEVVDFWRSCVERNEVRLRKKREKEEAKTETV